MGRGTTIYNQATGNVTAYKNWFQPLSTILNQAQPRTADTGQVNWASVATEGTGVRDFEVFAMGGSLQATAPIYIRTDYQGSTTGGVYLTVGTSTDGAGNIGGLTVAKATLQGGSPQVSNNLSAWASCDGSYFTFMSGMDPLNSGLRGQSTFIVERTRDLSGNPTADGFHVWRWQAGTGATTTFLGCWTKLFMAQTQPPNVDWTLPMLVPDLLNTNNAFIGNISYAYPVYTQTPPFIKGASKALMFGFAADWPRGQTVTVDHYGTAMTFVSTGDAMRNPIPAMSDGTTGGSYKYMCPLMRWD